MATARGARLAALLAAVAARASLAESDACRGSDDVAMLQSSPAALRSIAASGEAARAHLALLEGAVAPGVLQGKKAEKAMAKLRKGSGASSAPSTTPRRSGPRPRK